MTNWKVKLDPVARKLGGYLAYTISEREFIGRASKQSVKKLEFFGWEEPPTAFGIPLEAAKKHPETGGVHTHSLRKVNQSNPRWQYHLHAWSVNGETYSLACHEELRPDFTVIEGETVADAKNRLERHFRPTYNTDYFQGKAPNEVIKILS